MAYVSSVNRPQLVFQLIANPTTAHWIMMGTDAASVVRVNGYVTDARTLGLKAGDTITYTQINSATPPVIQAAHAFRVATINTNGSADLTDGVATAITNTD